MIKRVLVTGKNSQLGQSILKIAAEYPQYDFTFAGREALNLADAFSIQAYFQDKRFEAIINCAAYTAVDKAESEPELADQINHLSVRQLAEIAKQHNAIMIHVSTDYVFNGESFKPNQEGAPTGPQGVYGLTKLKGEQAFQEISPAGCILRTSWVYSEFGNNFVKTMLRLGQEREQLGVIFDQIGTPTYATDLATAILKILNAELLMVSEGKIDSIQNSSSKSYHYSNEGVCSWYDFAKAIFELSGIDCKVNPIETKDYPTPAKRPHFSVMNKAKIKADYDLQIPYWRDSLDACLKLLDK